MKTFYIFRHGQTYFSKNQIPYGDNEHTAHILPESRGPIENIAEYLKSLPLTELFRSEFLRCQETAKIIESKTDFHFESHPLFNEFTESDFSNFLQRMKDLTAFLQTETGDHIAICTHGAVVAALQKLLVGETFEAHELMYYPQTGVLVQISGTSVKNIDFNR